jgi:hypothetical protein
MKIFFLKLSSLLAICLAFTAMMADAASPQFGRSAECFFCAGFDQTGAAAIVGTNPHFERMKSLAGGWVGTNKHGKSVKVTYSVVSGGTAVMEKLDSPEGGNMVTMYHPDGERLMVTHYCSIGNQPRMVEVPRPGDNDLVFSFFDVTNQPNTPNHGHMRGLKFHFQDKNHFIQEWTFGWGDGRQETETLTLHRAT